MKNLLFKIIISSFSLSLLACSSTVTRENSPEKFNLLKTGTIKKANILKFRDCLIEGFEVRNRIAYNVQTKQQVRTDGYRVESYGGGVFLILSVDIFNSGKTQLLRAKNSTLTDLSKQINTFDICLAKFR